MSKAEKINLFTKAYHDYKNIQDIHDLKKNKLTLSDYESLEDILKELSGIDGLGARTFNKSVAEWLKRHRFNVQENECGTFEINL